MLIKGWRYWNMWEKYAEFISCWFRLCCIENRCKWALYRRVWCKVERAECTLVCLFAPEFLEYLWSCVLAVCYAYQSYMLTVVILFDLPRCQNCCLAGAQLTTVCKRAAACRHRRFMKLSRPFGESSKLWFGRWDIFEVANSFCITPSNKHPVDT